MCVPIKIDLPTDPADRRALRFGGEGSGAQTEPAGTAPATPTAPAVKDPTKPQVNYGTESGGATPAELLAQQQGIANSDAAGAANVLNQQITQQALLAQQNQQAILDAQKNASDALNQGFLSLTQMQKDAMTQAEQLRKNTGQASRKPNYSVSLKANKAANSGGVSSTMLTGASGVAPAALTLGRPALLGGN